MNVRIEKHVIITLTTDEADALFVLLENGMDDTNQGRLEPLYLRLCDIIEGGE